jgi:hypothetical protein
LEEAIGKVAALREQLEAAEKEVIEATAKKAESDAELQAVMELAAVGSAVGATNMAGQMLQWVLEALQLDGPTRAAITAQAQAAIQVWPQMVPQPPGMGQQAAAAAAEQAPAAGSQAAGAAAVTMAQQKAAATAAEAAQLQAAATAAAARATAAAGAATAAGQQQAAAELAAAAAGTQAAAAAAARPASLAAPGTPVGALLQGRRPTRSHSPGRGRNSLLLAAA